MIHVHVDILLSSIHIILESTRLILCQKVPNLGVKHHKFLSITTESTLGVCCHGNRRSSLQIIDESFSISESFKIMGGGDVLFCNFKVFLQKLNSNNP